MNRRQHIEHNQMSAVSYRKKRSILPGIFMFLLVIAIIGAIGIGVLYIFIPDRYEEVRSTVAHIIGDPVGDVIYALETEDFIVALDLAANLDSEALEERIRERLSTIEYEFISEVREYSITMTELSIIDRMNFHGISSKITSVRNTVSRLNDSRIAFNTAELLLAEGDYAAAIPQFMLVIEEDPNYDRASNRARSATDTLRNEALVSAENYSAYGDYESAISILNNALLVIENDSELTLQMTLYKAAFEIASRQRILDTASNYADANNWANAIATLNMGLIDMPGDVSIEDRLLIYRQLYVTSAITDADILVDQGEHDEAIAMLSNVLNTLPDNMQIMEQIDRIMDLRPISMSILAVIDSRNYRHEVGLPVDYFGGQHYEAFRFWAYVQDIEDEYDYNYSYVTYSLSGSFSLFTAYIAASSELHPDIEFAIEITLDDDITVFSHEGFEADSSLVPIRVSVSNAAAMTISVRASIDTEDADFWDLDNQSIYLVNAEVTR